MKFVGIAAGLALALLAGVARAASQQLVILHDNDLHGHLRDFCYVEVAKGPEERCGVGGAARRATLIRSLRTAAAPAPVLLIDTGDTTTRGPLATEYEGVDEIAAMNALGYDLAAIGNNEFKLKDAVDAHDAAGAQAALARLIRLSRFAWVAANVSDANGAFLTGAEPFVVREVGPLRIAFLGLTTGRSKSYPQTAGLIIGDPVEAAKLWIPKARAEADVVIAVTHIGVMEDRRLARETRGLAAIIGGDSHTFLYQPALEKNLDGQTVPIVQDGEFGVRLGEMRLTFEGDEKSGWRLASFDDRLVAVDGTIVPDLRLAALVESYARPLDVTVGRVPAVGPTPAERARLTAEDMAAAWKAALKTDVGLQPQGALFDDFRATQVTRYQVRSVLPFHDTLWRGQIAGAALKSLLETPSVAGVVRATIAPADIDPARTYTVAAMTFIGTFIGGGADTGVDARVAAEAWLAAQRP